MIFNILYPRAYIPHQADMMLKFDVTASLGLHNYKVEKQNKQIKTFQVVLFTRPSVGGAGSVCGGSLFPW